MLAAEMLPQIVAHRFNYGRGLDTDAKFAVTAHEWAEKIVQRVERTLRLAKKARS